MPADLADREVVVLEQAGHPGPVRQQAPDPDQADQPDADLDAVRPVNPGEEGIRPPPGAQLVSDALRVPLVAAEEPRRRQQSQVVQPGHFPDLLDVPGLRFGSVVDPEGVPAGR